MKKPLEQRVAELREIVKEELDGNWCLGGSSVLPLTDQMAVHLLEDERGGCGLDDLWIVSTGYCDSRKQDISKEPAGRLDIIFGRGPNEELHIRCVGADLPIASAIKAAYLAKHDDITIKVKTRDSILRPRPIGYGQEYDLA